MFTRSRAFVIALSVAALAAGSALAQVPAPAAAPAAPAAQRDPNAPILTETFQDWTLRCFNVRGPAPCDMLQVAVNKQNQQRVISVSIAYVPQSTRFAMQIVAPLGVTLSKGLTMGTGAQALKNVHFTRCTRDGCYVEVIVEAAVIDALSRGGASTNIVVFPYGRTTEAKLPLSLKGFAQSIQRLKVVAAEKATRAPQPAPRTPAPAPAPAAPRPAAPAPAPH